MSKNITNTSPSKKNIVTWSNKNNGKIITISKSDYEVLTTKDPNTLYLIVDNVDNTHHHSGGADK